MRVEITVGYDTEDSDITEEIMDLFTTILPYMVGHIDFSMAIDGQTNLIGNAD